MKIEEFKKEIKKMKTTELIELYVFYHSRRRQLDELEQQYVDEMEKELFRRNEDKK